MTATTADHCQACGAAVLLAHLDVAPPGDDAALNPATDRYGTALAAIVRCARCGHMQLRPMPDAATLDEAYGATAADDYLDEEAGQRETTRRILARVERHAGPGDLLDLGCWVGFFSAEARDRGWRTVGVEPSAFASAYARERLGLDVRTAPLLDADLPRASFDVAVLGDVIEHLPRPGPALDRVRDLLRPGGLVVLMLPDAGSRVARILGRRWWSVLPTHVQYFTRASLRTLLEARGWTVLDVDTAPKAFTVRYYLERVRGYSAPLSRALVGAARRAGVAERMWAPDFRDRMLVVARRPAA